MGRNPCVVCEYAYGTRPLTWKAGEYDRFKGNRRAFGADALGQKTRLQMQKKYTNPAPDPV